jgi:tetratricopeptide (TPR) repeat protein
VGITTGEALVSLDANPSKGEGMASGDVVNTAARMQSAAPVNGIVVDETTYRATRSVITYEDSEAVEAKGKTVPVPAWRAVEARSRFGVDAAHEARSELVGRDRELAALRDALDRARYDSVPQLVTLVGVPGIGKSRVLYELSKLADADPELVTWHQGRCLAYGDGVSLWALGEIVKAEAGVLDRDSDDVAAAKLHAATASVLPEATEARWVESHLRPLIGLEAGEGVGGDRRDEAFAAWRRYYEALATRRPLVLVVEDLHWADDALLDFVDQLVDWLTDVPLLVVCTARPELLERRPGWGGGKLNALTLGLAPLSPEQTATLLSNVLPGSTLSDEAQEALLERAEGNPLYAEQFAHLVLERGSADQLVLPETLQGILAARLDGLSADEKDILRDASVLGKVFWTGALGRDSEDVIGLLLGLQHKGFVRRQPRSSVESEAEWAFSHMLLRDVAYGQLPRADRARRHREMAVWIDSLGRPDDHAELLAHHWRSALELGRAAGLEVAEIVETTRRALREAGDRAFAVNAYPAAASYYGDALALWPEDDVERPRLLYRYAEALFVATDERALAALEEARDVLVAVDDRETAAEADLAVSRIWWRRGDKERASRHLARATELAGSEPSRATARVLATIARLFEDPHEGLRRAQEALAMADALEIDELRAHALTTIGMAKLELGDPTGQLDFERALEVALASGSSVAGVIVSSMTVSAFLRFELRRATELLNESRRIAERFGDAASVRWAKSQQTTAAFIVGNWVEALRLADRAITECESGSPHYLEASLRECRGRIREARGDVEGALSDYRLSLSLARATGVRSDALPRIGPLVLALEEHGPAEEAHKLAAEAVELARAYPQEAVWSVPQDLLLSRVALEFEGALREALHDAPHPRWKELAFVTLDREFVRAAEIWAAAGSPTWEARLRLRAAEELLESGRADEAEVELERALSFYRSVGADFFVERGERLFARSA